MSESISTTAHSRNWFNFTIVTLLIIQLVLLWLQGAMLNRQHAELLSLRIEIRNLSAALGETMANESWGHIPPISGTSGNIKHTGIMIAAMQEEEPIHKELEETRESATEAVKQARETQEKLSIAENVRKAEEKAIVEKEKRKWHHWLGLALLMAVGAFFLGSYISKNK